MADMEMIHTARSGLSTLLVTDDRALALLISTEATELAMPLCVVSEVRSDEDFVNREIILDLDTRGNIQAALRGETEIRIGICRNAATIPPTLRTQVRHVLERPFSTAKIRQLLRQIQCGEQPAVIHAEMMSTQRTTSETITIEQETTARMGEISVHLTPKEAALLRRLLDKRGQIVTKRELDECLGKDEAAGNRIEVYLCHLRRKLEKPTGVRLITTIRGVGYRLENDELQ